MSTDRSEENASILQKIHLAVFPIFTKEVPKFLPMALLNFVTIFSFTMLRNTKDVLLLSAPNVAGASLPYAKFFLVLPISIIFSIIYIKLRNSIEFKKTYYVVMTFFVLFFAFFNFVLFPLQEYIHPDPETIRSIQLSFPVMANFIGLAGVWSFALYYVMAELWGTYTLSVLFWQFANENVTTEESKRYYPLFILIGNIALIGLSFVLEFIAKSYESNAGINFINLTIIASGAVMMFIFYYTNNFILTQERFQAHKPAPKKKKVKLSLSDSFKELFQSKYILYIAIIVLSYGIMINIFETVWKEQLKVFFTVDGVTNQNQLLLFMSTYTFYTGVSTIILNYISKGIIRKCGWIVGASVTPIVATLSCVIFFLYCMNTSYLDPILVGLGAGAMFAVMFGASGVVFSKSSKYAFFDPTKEMSFIPIPADLRASGKAAVDGVGARLGKSGGGLIQIFLAFVITSFTGEILNAIDLVPFLIFIVILLGAGWLYSVISLNKLYLKAVEEDTTQVETTIKV